MIFNDTKIMKVAAYCRVSTDSSDQANSLQSQQSYFTHYINRNPMWELSQIYVDEGLSGTSTKKRKAFNKMIADAQLKKFNYIITKEISRFARNTLDSIYYTRKLKEFGIGVIFMNDNLFTLDPDAELRLTIMSSIAQEESRKTSDRVKWGQKRRMEQGVVFGRDMIGYNVKNGEIHIEPKGAEIVRLIFHKYTIEHKGTTTIARELKEAGITTLTNKDWTNTVILRLLRNEKYCGDLVQKKTYTPDYLTHEKKYNNGQEEKVIIRNHHEPIISRELFDATQRELAIRSISDEQRKRLSNRYCFSGKITCAECGSNYVFHSKKMKNGSCYQYWQCYQKRRFGKQERIDSLTGKKIGCNSMQIGHNDLKNIISEIVATLNLDTEKYLSILRKQLEEVFATDNNNSYKEIKLNCEKTVNRRASLVDLYLDKLITKDEFKERSTTLDKEIEKLKYDLENAPTEIIDETNQETAITDCLTFAKNLLQSTTAQNQNNNIDDKSYSDATSTLSDDLSINPPQSLTAHAPNKTANNTATSNTATTLSDDFIKTILDKITIEKHKNISVKLNLLPHKWKFSLPPNQQGELSLLNLKSSIGKISAVDITL